MKTARLTAAIGSVALMAPIAVVTGVQHAVAHGAMEDPISRSYACYLEGPENPASDVCQAVVDVGGPQPLYDWMEVNVADAAGRHQDIIPDGELCSAGRDKYAGLDLARADWPTTPLPSDSDFTFRYHATAPHAGGYTFYVTKDGYDPTQPLAWDDLEPEPFLTVDDPQLVDGYYLMPGRLPAKTGRHLIYAIWQRTDSPEAFYACSDVMFDGDDSGGDDSGGDDSGGDDSGGDDSGGDDSGGDESGGDSGSAESGDDDGDDSGGGDASGDNESGDDDGTGGGDEGGSDDDPPSDDGPGDDDCTPDEGADPTTSSTHDHTHDAPDGERPGDDHTGAAPEDPDPLAGHDQADEPELATTGAAGFARSALVGSALVALAGAVAMLRPRRSARHRWMPAHRRSGH